MKRFFDILASLFGLLALSPVLLTMMLLIWWQDRQSPFYIAPRVGKHEKLFNIVKLRSMIVGADKSNVDSTSSDDFRITPIGHFVRKTKLDELTQLWNVLKGEMSLVGPRPNVERETILYTDEEKKLLTVKPGITDLASIVFSDENDILETCDDPDIGYNQLIRPWKSRLGILYVENQQFFLDIRLIFITIFAIASKDRALIKTNKILCQLGASKDVVEVSKRRCRLRPWPPPGADCIVNSRQ
jgi:lipopolysaccharide/colanic/teichoic acid biosynthesis glycosyltransferase